MLVSIFRFQLKADSPPLPPLRLLWPARLQTMPLLSGELSADVCRIGSGASASGRGVGGAHLF